MKKTYVLDTNILLSSPEILLSLEDNDIIIPDTVLEELDNHKSPKKGAETSYFAREAIRILKELGKASKKSFSEGVPTPAGGKVTVLTDHLSRQRGDASYLGTRYMEVIPEDWSLDKADNRILAVTKNLLIDSLILKDKGLDVQEVILISNDSNMYIKGNSIGITVEGFKKNEVDTDKLYTGRGLIEADDEMVSSLRHGAEMKAPDGVEVYENEYVTIRSPTMGDTFGKIKKGMVVPLDLEAQSEICGIKPKNLGQKFLWDALCDKDIPLVICRGCAGTGKTLLAEAVGMDFVYEGHNGRFSKRRMILSRSRKLGEEDPGFLPGEEEDKMAPLLLPFIDNLENLFDSDREKMSSKDIIYDMINQGVLEMRSMAYMRGRSIQNAWLIIDEAQNCTPAQMLEIVTRAGTGSKIIILGDIDQIDDPHLSKRNNGLVFVSERMKESSLCAQIEMYESEAVRSPLAIEAAQRLKL